MRIQEADRADIYTGWFAYLNLLRHQLHQFLNVPALISIASRSKTCTAYLEHVTSPRPFTLACFLTWFQFTGFRL